MADFFENEAEESDMSSDEEMSGSDIETEVRPKKKKKEKKKKVRARIEDDDDDEEEEEEEGNTTDSGRIAWYVHDLDGRSGMILVALTVCMERMNYNSAWSQ